MAVPAAGHVNPLLPLAGALLDSGHEVGIACGEDPGGAIGRCGAEYLKVGRTESDWFDTLRNRVRGFPGDGIPPQRINHYFVPRVFADIGASDMLDDVVEVGRRFAPDLLVFETYAFAAPLAAKVLGVPAVHHLISPMLAHEVMELADDALRPLWRSSGMDSPGWGGIYEGLTVEVSPASLDPLSVPAGESIRLRPAPPRVGPAAPSQPPIVYVTLGTFFGGNGDVFRTILEGLNGEDLEILVTVGAGNDPRDLGPVDGNVRVAQYIPQAELLPRCSVVVHHGGSGTMFGAVAHGLAQVVVPQGADNFLNADNVERCGIGLSILPGSLTPAEVRRCVLAALGDPSIAANCKRLEDEFSRMPGPDEVARDLVARYRGAPTV